ncbi:MAG: siroheme synthase CysG [Alphaproteobacteria bacterium]|nr:siroheme synthase CysG [Alphaproteobacteria bacterium]
MNALPIFVRLQGRHGLVVGGGAAAAKLRLLLSAGAEVAVVAPRICGEIADLVRGGGVDLVARGFVGGDVAGRAIVFAATGIDAVDERVAESARAAGVSVNVVDRPDASSFTMPAIVDRDPIVIAISTGGTAPILAREIRARLECFIPAGLGALARFAGSFRGAVRAVIPEPVARRRFWERFFDGPIAADVLAGAEAGAAERMLALVNRPVPPESRTGSVALVGAGPGDPDLLTMRALRVLRQADVVIHDNLTGPGILDHARRDAERIFVGKPKSPNRASQDRINRLMVDHARRGRRVVRLKGGDPLLFARGGEELAYLRDAGVAVTVVPGVTAALAEPSEAEPAPLAVAV